MDLWNEYEGNLIAGKYPLEMLIYPEGRSGFFLTSNATGVPAVIRLTETLNDGAEILGQWHAVNALNELHLVILNNCGEAVVDDVPLIYAVMERPDATLAEILRERPMTVDETRQITASIVSALKTLHEHGLVHRHLDSASVVALGETIKLRSDCVRKIANQDDASRLKQQDVRDFCILLLECLTQKRIQPEELPLLPQLPTPFGEIILNGLNGIWTLEEISGALDPAARALSVAASNSVANSSGDTETVALNSASHVSPGTEPAVGKAVAETKPASRQTHEPPPLVPARSRRLLVTLAVITTLIISWLLMHLLRHSPQTPRVAASGSSSTISSAVPPNVSNNADGTSPAPAPDFATLASVPSNAASWRIVAYSFRREDEAKNKAEALLRKHPWINPEVVETTGRSPYLVTLGGELTREEAVAFEQKLRAERFHHVVHLQEISAK